MAGAVTLSNDRTLVDGDGVPVDVGAASVTTPAVAAASGSIISSGAGAPVSTPDKPGDIYIDLTNDRAYLAVGSASAADWDLVPNAAGSGDLLSTNNLSDVANAATARSNLGLAIGVNVQAYSAVLAATTASFLIADETKLDGIEAGATADQTAAEILTKLLTVDGTGSLLDADLLDGIEASAFVRDTGDETIAGVKTFSSDPIIPDEAYNATNWNGVLEPPTKNAVRDKFEALDAIVAGIRTSPDTGTPGSIGIDVDLASGISGGDTLIGGTASGEDLTLGSTVHATRGTIFIRDQQEWLTESKSITTGTTALNAVILNDTYSFSSTSDAVFWAGNSFVLLDVSPTLEFSENANIIAAAVGMFMRPTIQNASGQVQTGGPTSALYLQPTYNANGAAFSATHYALRDSPIASSSASTMTMTAVSTVLSGLVVNTGGVTTLRQALYVQDASGAGSVTTQVALEIAALTKATTNIGIRNASTEVATPSVATLSAASSSITPNAKIKRLNNTSGGSLTLTSAPTVTDGQDGQILILFNSSAQNVVIQDQGTLASSNLRLSATTITLGTRDSIMLVYSSDIGDWIQIGQVNVL